MNPASANPVWPTPVEEQLLLACFAREPAEAAALLRGCSDLPGAAVTPLLSTLYRRWPTLEDQLMELGKRAYLTTWRRNREAMDRLAGITAQFHERGIRWMALKGAALILRQNADFGQRPMSDVDVLIDLEHLGRTIPLLQRAGYHADEDATAEAIIRQSRVRHAWQFFGEPDWNFDLHWRPVSRCYSPEVTRLFWEGAETRRFGDQDALVPSPTDQLFQTCVHGLQWDWTRKVHWIADALTILGEPVDWERICQMAARARMSARLSRALLFLRDRFAAGIPQDVLERLQLAASTWESREYELLLKPCPLGVFDSFLWHVYHFLRIRPFDEGWREMPFIVAFPQYVVTFLGSSDLRSVWLKLSPHFHSRTRGAD